MACQAQQTLHSLHLLLQEQGVFVQEAAGNLLTQKMLKYVKEAAPVEWMEGPRQVVGTFTSPDEAALEAHAKTIYELAESGIHAMFPAHEHVNAYSALNLQATLTWPQRKDLVHALAAQEGVPKEDVWLLDFPQKQHAQLIFIIINFEM